MPNPLSSKLNTTLEVDVAGKYGVAAGFLTLARIVAAIGGQRVPSVADPVNPQDVSTKAYVDAAVALARTYADSVAQGLDVKLAARVITTSPIVLSGTQTQDGVSLQVDDRVLVAGQGGNLTTPHKDNGLYLVRTDAWVRAPDADTSAEVTSGLFTLVTDGTAPNKGTGWVLVTADPISLGTTALLFTQFSGSSNITAAQVLTALAAAAASVNINGQRLINVGTPSVGTDGATKAYSDSAATAAAAAVAVPLSNADPQPVGTVAAPGNATSSARANHVHAHGVQEDPNLHALATTTVHGFMSATDKANLAAAKSKTDSLVTGQAATVGKVTADAFFEAPTALTYAAAIALDTSNKNDFTIGALTANTTITFSNAASGRSGKIWVRQDATGSRTMTFALDASISGTWTIVKDSIAGDTNPQAAANSFTLYTYEMVTVAGANIVYISKAFLV